MKPMLIWISKQDSVETRYVDFESVREKPTALWRTKLANALFGAAHYCRTPFEYFAGLFTQSRHVTPGRYIEFSENPRLDGWVKKGLSHTYLMVGGAGGLLSLIPWSIGLVLEKSALMLRSTEIHYFESPIEIALSQQAQPLNSVTRNMAVLPLMISNYSNLRPTQERLPELVAGFLAPEKNVDIHILCLQEVFGAENSRYVVERLQSKFKYFLYEIAPRAFGLSSGLLLASKKPIIAARFIKPPLPLITKSAQFHGLATSIEGITNKGILYAVIQNGEQMDLVVNAHIKSNIGFDHCETQAIEQIRGTGLRVMAQGLFDYIDELQTKGITITHVYFGGDLNVSDVQETGPITYERSGMFLGKRIREGMQDYSFLFDSLFPNPAIETWLMDTSRKPNALKTGLGQEKYNQPQQPMPDVTFDHVGFFENQATACPKHPGCLQSYTIFLERFDDQNHSRDKGTPSSDHAGLLQIIKQSCRRQRNGV